MKSVGLVSALFVLVGVCSALEESAMNPRFRRGNPITDAVGTATGAVKGAAGALPIPPTGGLPIPDLSGLLAGLTGGGKGGSGSPLDAVIGLLGPLTGLLSPILSAITGILGSLPLLGSLGGK